MAEKGILFSGDMVRAILAGNKTVTRRPVTQNKVDKFILNEHGRLLGSAESDYHGNYTEIYPTIDDAQYQPGDILYVRETWNHVHGQYSYRADWEEGCLEGTRFARCVPVWRPSIHMPREAARIFLRVTGVRVERLQEITEEGAAAEGFEPVGCDCSNRGAYGCTDCMNTGMLEPAMLGFVDTWNDIYTSRGYGWEQNPWVWVIEFERIEVDRG